MYKFQEYLLHRLKRFERVCQSDLRDVPRQAAYEQFSTEPAFRVIGAHRQAARPAQHGATVANCAAWET